MPRCVICLQSILSNLPSRLSNACNSDPSAKVASFRMNASQEIEILIRAKYPILYIVSWEEKRVEEALYKVCSSLNRTLHTWSVTQGMKPPVIRPSGAPRTSSLSGELEALVIVQEAPEYTVFLLKDFHPYMRDYRVIRLLRDLAV